jgi:chromosome segregation ATPase
MTLDSPVSLLWAHQLRREHATIVAQIEELKALHPSALEHKRLVTRSEKAEATCNTLRQEVAELRTGHEKTVKVIEELTKDLQVKENTHRGNDAAREEKEEGLQLEVKTLSDALTRHQGELCSIADEVQNLQNQVEERNEATEQRLLQRENGMAELRRLIQVLDQKIEDAVTVIKDSIECTKPDGQFLFDSVAVSDSCS